MVISNSHGSVAARRSIFLQVCENISQVKLG